MNEQVCVGAFAGAFGVRGELRLKSFCATPEDIVQYAPLTTEDGGRSFRITLIGQTKNALVARVDSIHSKEQADALRGVRLFAPRDRLPALEAEEYYHADLIGLEVVDTGGTVLGRVRSVLNHGAGDFLEIHGPSLKTPLLLPFTQAAVPTVDLGAGRIVADPPEDSLPG